MRSLPAPPGSTVSSEKLQKKHWDPDSQNIAGNYAEGIVINETCFVTGDIIIIINFLTR